MKRIQIKPETDFCEIKDNLFMTQNSSNLEIGFNYVSDFRSAKILRDIISEVCVIYCISDDFKSKLILLVDELNNNAIEYGSQVGDMNLMYVKIESTDNYIKINIEVTDSGKGNFAKKAVDMEQIRKERLAIGFKNHKSIRGRGLFMIIEKIADKLYFKDSNNGGLTVGIEKILQK